MRKIFLSLLTLFAGLSANAQSDATIECTNLEVKDYTSLLEQCYYVASNDNYLVALWVNTNSVYGTFGDSDVDLAASYIMSGEVELAITSATVTVIEMGGNPLLMGTATCSNGVVYTLNLSSVPPEKSREENLTFNNAKLEDATSSDGVFDVYGYDDTQTRYISLKIKSSQVPGTYATEDLNEIYTYAIEVEGGDKVYFSLVNASLTVAQIDATKMFVGGKLLFQNNSDATDCPEYNVEMYCNYTPEGLSDVKKSDVPMELFNLQGVKVRDGYKGVVVGKGVKAIKK